MVSLFKSFRTLTATRMDSSFVDEIDDDEAIIIKPVKMTGILFTFEFGTFDGVAMKLFLKVTNRPFWRMYSLACCQIVNLII